MTATEELRRMLDERGIEHDDYDPDPRYSGPTSDRKTEWDGASFREWPNGTIRFGAKGTTPAQAIAATVGAGTCGDGKTTVAVRPEQEEWDEQLEVNDGVQQWYSPLVHPPKAIELHFEDGVARFVPDAATVGRRDTMELWPEWEQVLFANVTDEVAQDNLNECVHELLDKAATVGRSCESCPEMDNPDSYIRHLQSALRWHDEHVPRPTNPRNTCAVLQGEKPPEEVLFVGPDGVTHYQPEGATVGVGTWEPSKEWKVWHESLRHAKPASIRDVVEEILFDAIEFGGDMGPNGNVWSGVDEGIALTEGCIDGWVKSIESIAATVGAGTCHIEERHGDWYCTECGEMVGTCDLASELCIDGNEIELWCHCPNCGRRIEVDE